MTWDHRAFMKGPGWLAGIGLRLKADVFLCFYTWQNPGALVWGHHDDKVLVKGPSSFARFMIRDELRLR
jgi:hypothetical protein